MTLALKFLINRGISNEIITRARLRLFKDRLEIPYYFSGINKNISVKIRKLLLNENEPKYFWKSSGMSPTYLYLWSSLFLPKKFKKIVYITEGELDALLLLSILNSDFYNDTPIRIDYAVLALPLGANCWKKKWTIEINKYINEKTKIFSFFDNDDAGVQGLKSLVDKLQRSIYQADWPDWMKSGQDLTDFLKRESFNNLKYRLVEPVKNNTENRPSLSSLIVTKSSFKEEDLERLKSYPLENLLESFGIKLKKCSLGYTCLCPFHKETKPSFYVYKETNSFYCFSCGKGGSIIDFLRYYDNRSVSEAIEYLRKLIYV